MSNYAYGVKGQVRLVANTSTIVQFLPDDLSSFLQLHPTVKIDLEAQTSETVHKLVSAGQADLGILVAQRPLERSEEHTSELQSLMRISYAVFCLKKKQTQYKKQTNHLHTTHQ